MSLESTLQKAKSKEAQYQIQIDRYLVDGPVRMGLTTSHTWRTDPKRLLFLLSRYKFVSKILADYKNVMEVGCGDGFGSRLLSQAGCNVFCADFDPAFIEEAKQREAGDNTREYAVVDFLKDGVDRVFDAAYSLDVIEHIHAKDEDTFLKNICKSIKKDGVCIIGSPSLESQQYASIWSKEGHVNCKSGTDMKKNLEKYFDHVFLFSMNDEVIHTGFTPMAHYLMALCVGVKK